MAEAKLSPRSACAAVLASRAETVATREWIGEYEVVRPIESGGMATVFLGRKHGIAGFSRFAAVKVIHPSLARHASFAQMFANEACICSQISHPNVIRVETFGKDDDGRLYMAMEYVDGCTLKDVLQGLQERRTQLAPALGAHIISQVAAGLHAAHETPNSDGQPLRIIHRDVSPANILLSYDGQIKVIDFGIAESRGKLASVLGGKSLQGKFRYMAPEQGRAEILDRRADVFSLGIVFWEVLVGRPLFAESRERAIREGLRVPDIPRPSEANPAVPSSLDAVVMRMLHEDREQRPCTALEVKRQIIEALPAAANRQLEELAELTRSIEEPDESSKGQPLRLSGRSEPLGRHAKPPERSSDEKRPAKAAQIQSIPSMQETRSLRKPGPSTRSAGAPSRSAGAPSRSAGAPSRSAGAPSREEPATSRRKRRKIVRALLLVTAISLAVLFVVVRGGLAGSLDTQRGESTLGEPGSLQSEPGLLSVTTQTDATIQVDGEIAGTTAIFDHKLSPGTYQVDVRLEGYERYRRLIEVKASQVLALNAPLVPLAKRSKKTQPAPRQGASKPPPKREEKAAERPKKKTRPAERPSVTAAAGGVKPECRTPYYFERGKKVFKPRCL